MAQMVITMCLLFCSITYHYLVKNNAVVFNFCGLLLRNYIYAIDIYYIFLNGKWIESCVYQKLRNILGMDIIRITKVKSVFASFFYPYI